MNITSKLNRLSLCTSKLNECRYFSLLSTSYKKSPPKYQTSRDLDFKMKQRDFEPLTQKIYIQNQEVKQYDGFSLVEPLIDTSTEPHKLHLIKKVGSIKGEAWWVRQALKKLGFETDRYKEWRVVHKVQPNTPEVNDMLWLCKHLVKITPISMDKSGEPSEADLKYAKLNLETGNLSIVKQLQTIEADNSKCYKINGVLVTEDKRGSDTFPLDKKELHRYMHRRKDLQQLNSEYHRTKYEYKFDQDKPGVINVKGLPDTRLSEDP